jgi:hypothetical protein
LVVDTRNPADVARIPSDPTEWTAYADESDNNTDWQCSVHSNGECHTYPFPLDAPIEGGCCAAVCIPLFMAHTACLLGKHPLLMLML